MLDHKTRELLMELRCLRVKVNTEDLTATIVMPLELCHRLERLISEELDHA